MLQIAELGLAGALLLTPQPFHDHRGSFVRYCCDNALRQLGCQARFVQFNHSITHQSGSIRGLHLQLGEAAEGKLVRCIRGRVMDILLDLRRGSTTLLQHEAVELSRENGLAIYLPPGVAHGFQTMEDGTELIYHHTNYYAPEREAGVRFDDPLAAIPWPLSVADVSSKDLGWPLLEPGFTGYEVSSNAGASR